MIIPVVIGHKLCEGMSKLVELIELKIGDKYKKDSAV